MIDFPDDEPTDPGNGDRECERCGSRMIPLFTSYACPDGCDRIARGLCPKCGSGDHAPFTTIWINGARACRPCGAVWRP